MKNLWEKDFQPKDIITPKMIVEKQCEYINEKTNKFVLGKIVEYKNRIDSYKTVALGESIVHELSTSYLMVVKGGKEVNIQNELGEISEFNFTYEFFITSTQTPSYKYRVFFLQYNISMYPLTLVLDEAISEELGWVDYKKVIETDSSFMETLSEILNSNKVYDVVNSLYSLARQSIY